MDMYQNIIELFSVTFLQGQNFSIKITKIEKRNDYEQRECSIILS